MKLRITEQHQYTYKCGETEMLTEHPKKRNHNRPLSTGGKKNNPKKRKGERVRKKYLKRSPEQSDNKDKSCLKPPKPRHRTNNTRKI